MPDSSQPLNWFSRSLIEELPAAVYVCDSSAVVVAFNKRATELWGRTPRPGDTDQKFCGAYKLFRPDGRSLPHSETPMEYVLRTGEHARDQEVIIERPDGSRVTVLVNIAPIFDESGAQVGAVNCFQDLTVQKQAERERAELREELRQAQKLKAMGQLMGGVAHDFNNLLTPIIGSLDLLNRRGTNDARELRLIDMALQSAERAKLLVQRLLAFARRQPLQARAIDIASLILDMGDLIRTSVGPQIKVTFDLGSNLPPARVDPQQIEMAILNLSLNARDAMPDGGILAIWARSEAVAQDHPSKLTPGPYIRLSIADTGAGMDEATMAQATEPFFSTKGIGKGTGLGLSMVDGLVSQLGGGLVLSSKPGRGTTAELLLPVSAESIASAEPAARPVADAQAIGRVLLVDDEDIVRASTAGMLSELGYEVVEAASAEEALSLLDREPDIDGIITDHLMPGMSGVELAQAIRVKRPGTPVLLLSGFAGAEGMAVELPLLTKPFRQSNLAEALTALLPQAAK
jgi:signal transduction histidine kinase/CheY-like chemotaxis protein